MKGKIIPSGEIYDVISIDYLTNTVTLQVPGQDSGQEYRIEQVRLIPDPSEHLKGMNIFRPEPYWMIPLIGWIMIVYTLFTKPDSVIIFDSTRDERIMVITLFGPILVLFLPLMF
jgi:hypothetical protein